MNKLEAHGEATYVGGARFISIQIAQTMADHGPSSIQDSIGFVDRLDEAQIDRVAELNNNAASRGMIQQARRVIYLGGEIPALDVAQVDPLLTQPVKTTSHLKYARIAHLYELNMGGGLMSDLRIAHTGLRAVSIYLTTLDKNKVRGTYSTALATLVERTGSVIPEALKSRGNSGDEYDFYEPPWTSLGSYRSRW